MNEDICESKDLSLVVYLYDLNNFEKILFDYGNISDETVVEKDRWNTFTDCFVVLGRTYFLAINAISTCTLHAKSFISVDELVMKEIEDEDLVAKCKNLEVTEFPETTIITNEETTIITSTSQITSTSNDEPTGNYLIFNF